MRLNKFVVRQFRNLSEVSLDPHPVLNLLFGENGQGKTSLIEAIYFCSTLHSFRTGHTSDLQQIGKEGFSLEALFEDSNTQSQLKIRVVDKQKKLFLNEKPVSVSHFLTRLRTVVFSPESLGSIKSGPEARRDLVDQAVFQLSPEAAISQKAFQRVLRQRNACLKQIRDGELKVNTGQGILESLNPLYLKAAAEVVESRLRFLDIIFQKIEGIYLKMTGEKNTLSYSYKSRDQNWEVRQIGAIEGRLRSESEAPERQAAEVATGATLTGPHRHDITFVFNGNDSRIFCSQGQQRAVILAFKIAEIVYHNEVLNSHPILLLDDVLSEFDETKRNFLIEFLSNNEAQTFLTTTDHVYNLQGSKVLEVIAGKISSKGRGTKEF